jgi:uncharacterized protein (TIGR01777 family)
MKVVIAGGTGFLGSALVQQLTAEHHDIVILTRRGSLSPAPRITYVKWTPDGQVGPWAKVVEGAHAIINLAGASIAHRWTAGQKAKIRESRLLATGSIVNAIGMGAVRPRVLVNASAVGFYGDRGAEALTERSAVGTDFLARVCQEWEEAAKHADDVARVVLIRTGIVLDREHGALPKMMPPFLFFAGGPLGTGDQYMSWIHREDWVRLVIWSLKTSGAAGPLNATGPNPVSNAHFSRALGKALHRPSWLHAPAFALKLGLGEMAEGLLLSGQRALPERATELGFTFKFINVADALSDIFGAARAGQAA